MAYRTCAVPPPEEAPPEIPARTSILSRLWSNDVARGTIVLVGIFTVGAPAGILFLLACFKFWFWVGIKLGLG